MSPQFARVTCIQVELLGDVWAAFSPASGETVLLNDEGAALLEILDAQGVADALTLADGLATECGVPVDEVAARMNAALSRLEETGLVRRSDEPNRSA